MSNRISITQGTSDTIEVDVVDGDGTPLSLDDLAGATATFVVQAVADTPPSLIAFDTVTTPKSLAFIANQSAMSLSFMPTDTSGLALGSYFYQLKITLADGTVFDAIDWTPFDVVLGGSATPTPPVFPNQVAVNENFRLPNDLAYFAPDGTPIQGAQIRVYLKSDYDAGNLASPVGITTTNAFGGWTDSLLLTTGFTYTARFEKPYEWGPDTKEFFA